MYPLADSTIADRVWYFIRGDTVAGEFEQLVYADQNLELALGRDLYLDLLAANYRDAQVVVGVQGRLWEWLIATYPRFAVETYGYQTEPWHTIRLFPATCQTCGHEFAAPILSDFAYGEFILSTETGREYAYLNSLVSAIWDEIEALHNRVARAGTALDRERVDTLQWVIARCADPLRGESLDMGHRCPVCQSRSVSYDLSTPLHDALIPVVSYRSFMALSDAAKIERVRELVMAYRR